MAIFQLHLDQTVGPKVLQNHYIILDSFHKLDDLCDVQPPHRSNTGNLTTLLIKVHKSKWEGLSHQCDRHFITTDHTVLTQVPLSSAPEALTDAHSW